MDEAQVGLIYPVLKCWMKVGVQKRIPMATAQRKSQVLAGVLNWRSEQVHCRELARLDSENIVAYLEWLFTDVYPHQQIVLVLDNASFHHSAAVQAALTCFEHRVLVLWLPPYSPDLNPIERFWKHLKATVCANHLYASVEQLIQSVRDFITAHNTLETGCHLSFSKHF
jgi:transposase